MNMLIHRRRFLHIAACSGAVLSMSGDCRAGGGELRGAADEWWTAAEIGQRLGISMAVFQKVPLGPQHVATIREAGIRQIELLLMPQTFDYRNRRQVAQVVNECRKQQVAIVSMHGNLKLRYGTDDPNQRAAVLKEALSELRFAEDTGASVLVAHLGAGQRAERTASELLDKTQGFRVRLTTENMLGPLDGYVALVDAIDSDRFGLTVDIGHARDADGINPFVKKGPARRALKACEGRVIHLHLHDTFDLKSKPDHRPPLHPDGLIQWADVFAALKEVHYPGVLLFEDGRGEDPQQWIQHTARFPARLVALDRG